MSPDRTSREQLLQAVRDVLPEEGMDYVRTLNELRFKPRPGSDQLFFDPKDLVSLLIKTVMHRGDLQGDDRDEMMAEGVLDAAFELPDTYQYLKVPAQGKVGLLSIDELAHWVPVTLRKEPEPHTRIGFRRAAPRTETEHLVFTIDTDFQRMGNYATVIIAPNWFGDKPSTQRAVLDAFLGAPVPSKLQSISVSDPLAVAQGWQDGSETTVAALRSLLPGRPLWLACRNRNLPGT